jgi:hypothetical protein
LAGMFFAVRYTFNTGAATNDNKDKAVPAEKKIARL